MQPTNGSEPTACITSTPVIVSVPHPPMPVVLYFIFTHTKLIQNCLLLQIRLNFQKFAENVY